MDGKTTHVNTKRLIYSSGDTTEQECTASEPLNEDCDENVTIDGIGEEYAQFFMSPQWVPNLHRLSEDTKKVYRCMVSNRLNYFPYYEAFRRSLFDMYMLGRLGRRLKRSDWETIMHLSPTQSRRLHRTLRFVERRIIPSNSYIRTSGHVPPSRALPTDTNLKMDE
ncbi:US1 immediate early phosphoprotein, ICP22like protein [Meleagrid alphaherpesvirus 1]|uniref:US1 ICP22 regulatory protein n=2 Tax=Mardivirus TaxID=180252 RepID=Q77L63_MEHV1|nr:regulatory protein ICP22 [Meleagrid alphaherpesvirus 1]AKQ48643.1 regulatory protein ICP22 [iBAC vector pMeHV1-C7]AKQ48715.1 regulatory protein ICP22 [iBAC vector pMeHV1-C9]AKQ48787.1 regulatory protein ICP22 [iBAC vector pMeHV1-C10]AKQ48859.1 regulatory protein ICP22 [iBAC vector pMeHV1-C17]AKQ48931.1 regulatory protein ICP22 [iBAC vector pMeHV1-C18]CAA48612.1 unnamed protein product [Gallid alphaherpesvirus 2]